jgi:hypothetical protein
VVCIEKKQFANQTPASEKYPREKKAPRTRDLGLEAADVSLSQMRLQTTSGPATQAGKAKPEKIQACGPHTVIVDCRSNERK